MSLELALHASAHDKRLSCDVGRIAPAEKGDGGGQGAREEVQLGDQEAHGPTGDARARPQRQLAVRHGAAARVHFLAAWPVRPVRRLRAGGQGA